MLITPMLSHAAMALPSQCWSWRDVAVELVLAVAWCHRWVLLAMVLPSYTTRVLCGLSTVRVHPSTVEVLPLTIRA
jgi:hypothetical protein